MTPANQGGQGHYAALGVTPAASQRQIERAFCDWSARFRSGGESPAAYRRAEEAYRLLADPEARGRHDRQLGLVAHPAWTSGNRMHVRSCIGRAVRELESGHAPQARRLLDRAVALAPEDPHARSYLALVLARTGGCLHEAARHGRHAVERRPQEAAFWFNLAEVYGTAGLRSRAWACRVRAWHAVVAILRGRMCRW